MHAYLATLCRDLAAEVVRVGGVADHVHIVTTLPRTLSQAQLLSRVFLATRLWRVFGKPESTRGRSPLR